MWSQTRFSVWAVAGLVILAQGRLLQAQFPRNNPRQNRQKNPVIKLERFSAKGTIVGMMPGMVKIVTESKENWMLKVGPKASIRVEGTAERDFLRVGQMIQFTGEVDQRRIRVLEPVSKLTVFTPWNERMPGAFPEIATDEEGEAADAKEPGDTESQKLVIGGRIMRMKGRRLTLAVPNLNPKLRVELGESVKIDLDMADPSIVKQGDNIHVSVGLKYGEGLGEILEGRIRLLEPATGPRKKGRRVPAPKRSRTAPTKEGTSQGSATP